MIELTERNLSNVIVKRPRNSHKGSFGRVVIVGGNAEYGGAAILAATAAIYAGSGLVTVACHLSNHASLHARLPEAMVIDFDDLSALTEVLSVADVVVIGCGLGLERLDLLTEVLSALTGTQKLVIDGSAITLFSENNLKLRFPQNTIFTPHEMELQRLSGLKIGCQYADSVQKFVNQLGAMVVAKSSETKVFSPSQETYFLTIGTPAQATGGMGDTLAGIIGGFLAQFHGEVRETVAAATYLHSFIAHDLATSQYVVLPSQIIEQLPKMMKRFEC